MFGLHFMCCPHFHILVSFSCSLYNFMFWPQATYRYLLCTLVCMAMCVIVKHKTTSWIEAKLERQLFNVADIKYWTLSKWWCSSSSISKQIWKIYSIVEYNIQKFFLTWCLVDKFGARIYAYDLGPCRFSANKNSVKEVRLKVKFSELSEKAFTKMIRFWKFLSMENSVL